MTERGPKTQGEFFQEMAQAAWQRGQAALQADDVDTALRWLARAHRIAPGDAAVTLTLAGAMLRQDSAAAQSAGGGTREAVRLLSEVVAAHDVREAWLALALARFRNRDPAGAPDALARFFSGHVLPADGLPVAAVDAIVAQSGAPGWCAVRADFSLEIHADQPLVTVDGVPLGTGRKLPPGARVVEASGGGRALLGSPIDLARLRRTEGVVRTRDGGLEGWAWHPANPDTDAVLTISDTSGRRLRVVAADGDMIAPVPLSRPRRLTVTPLMLARMRPPLRVTGRDGVDLLGSPLDPFAAGAAAASVARAVAARFPARYSVVPPPAADLAAVPADAMGPPAGVTPAPDRAAAIVIPVHGAPAATLACLDAVFATMPAGTTVIVVDDASPEAELAAALDALHAARRIRLLRHAKNAGFPVSANAGMREALKLQGRPDIVLLNSDAVPAPGWLERLRAAAHADGNTGTATPLSNDASILSYPLGTAAAPSGAALARLARMAAAANDGQRVHIPTAVGFCMYIRRECLAATGLFREDVFAQGYGEENDFCIRARALGWRHVGVPGAYVAHASGTSFNAFSAAARAGLLARNLDVLEQLHPGYRALVADFTAADPLAPARRRIDLARWRQGRGRGGSVVLVTHDSGGGVERVVRDRCEALRLAGKRPILLRPAAEGDVRPGLCRVSDDTGEQYADLCYRLPEEFPELLRLLRGDKPEWVENHHLLGHDPMIRTLAERLGVAAETHLHDYALLCPRVTLVGRDNRYCGEPQDTAVCDACVADAGSNIGEEIATAALRARSAAALAASRRVVVPSAEAATRLRRYFPAVAAEVAPLEDDTRPCALNPVGTRTPRRVAVIGGIGVHKGYDVLLACARDAAQRGLELRFVLVGHSHDDGRLFDTGRVFVTGPYREQDGEALLRAQDADIAWLPSIWPETWGFTLGLAWRAGLQVAAFDIGAMAERIRATGRGWVLPLGLPPASINNALLSMRGVASRPG